ncbi:MAG: 50S ribosomal protein L6 [Thermoprotei archaeon]
MSISTNITEFVKIHSMKIKLPENITAEINDKKVRINGPLGSIEKDFSHAKVSIELSNNTINVYKFIRKKRDISIVNTIASKIKNMITGVTRGYIYKLKIAYSHFPINVKMHGNYVLIENFIGERAPRKARIIGNVKIDVKGDEIIVSGIDLDEVSQTAANIQQATKIRKRDPRKFLDGIYISIRGEHIK